MRYFRINLVIVFIFAVAGATASSPDATKGQALLKAMSAKLAESKSFSFSTTEFHDTVNRKGERVKINTTRDVLVRRPDGFWTKYKGDRDLELWYDGKLLTGISASKKIYIQHQVPPTLDATMDMLAQRLNLDLPVSDILYSTPYEAFMTEQTSGGLVESQVINGSSCGHLVYTSPVVDWQLWIDEKTSLPCQLEMTYKKENGNPFYRIVFANWSLSATVAEGAFAHKIPEGYVRIPILERVLLKPADKTQTQPAKEGDKQ